MRKRRAIVKMNYNYIQGYYAAGHAYKGKLHSIARTWKEVRRIHVSCDRIATMLNIVDNYPWNQFNYD